MKEVLIIGGSGYVGKYVIERLTALRFSCVSVSRSVSASSRTIRKDLMDLHPKQNTLTKGFDAVVHLASNIQVDEFLQEPLQNFQNNVISTANLIENMRIHNPKAPLIFLSSDKIYGAALSERVMEDEIGKPLDPYGASKLCSELIIYSYASAYGIPYIILRSGTIFGPNQQSRTFIPYLMSKIANKETLIKVGNMNVVRNFTYISDIVDAITRSIMAKKTTNQVYNIVSFQAKIADVARKLALLAKDELGINIKFVHDTTRSRKSSVEPNQFTLDDSNSRRILRWKPRARFDQSIEETFKSYLH